jgi:hypothetical protein
MIFEHDKTSGKITASLTDDTLAQVYECLPEVCMNPTCDCNEVFLQFERFSESHYMGINLKDRTLIDRENPSNIDDFANQVFEQLNESDYKVLKELYVFHKKYGTEHYDYSQILVKFPKEDIEQHGAMVTYNEVLPYAKVFDITLEGTHYALEENYCVKNKCSCSEFVLCFYPILNENTDDYTQSETGNLKFSVRIDYQSKRWMLDENSTASTIDIASVQSAMESQYPEFYDMVQRRLQRMKLLYSNYLKRLSLEKTQKVGRNESCPCGSGKKYKKCCGAVGAFFA